jgi:uncharacterized protein (DUF983 family)
MEREGKDAFLWIMTSGWRGLCPRCGKGHMFKSWIKVADRCDVCGLDYSFATPDDGPAFFSLCVIAFPLLFFVMWIELAFSPPVWVHLVTSGPLLAIGCTAGLRPIKGWLVASQYVNRSEEAGTELLWAKLRGRTLEGGRTNFDD